MATTTAKTTKTAKTRKVKAKDRDGAAAEAAAKSAAAQGEDTAEETPSPLDQAHREARRLAGRYRRQLAPLAAIGATHAAGAAAAAADGGAAVGVLAATGTATGIAYAIGRRRLGKWSRAYAAVACTASMSWQATAAVVGAGHVQTLLWLGGAALALPWWIQHCETTPDVTAEQTVQDVTAAGPQAPAEPDWRTVRWGTYLAAQGRALPGSKLSDITEIPYGWTATVDLPRGEHWEKVASTLATIASVFDLPDGRVLAEPVNGAPVYRAHLTVLTTSPLEKVTTWTGPGLDPATGTFPVAVTADGEELHWRLWWPGAGMCHGLTAGTTGSGKSATFDLLLSEVAMSDRLIPVIIDGSGGMSLPDWIPHVPYTATTTQETIDLLERLEAAMDARFDKLRKVRWTDKHGRARIGRNCIDPTPDMPGVVVFIDEAHRPLMDADHGKHIRRKVEILTQMGRKVAFSVILATQQASVSQLGGSSVIRDMCKGGNVVALRTGERVSGGMVGNVALPEALHELPLQWPDGSPTQGLCYVTTARAIRSRTLWVQDPYACATGQTPVHLDALTRAHLNGGAPAATAPANPAAGDTDAPSTKDLAAQARAALNGGTPADPAQIARATGMTWRQAKTALADLHATT